MTNTTTITRTNNFISLVFAGTGADYLYSTDTTGNPEGKKFVKVASIMWHPDADSDKLLVRDGASTGAIVYIDEGAAECESRIKYYGGGKGVRMNPSITVSQCSSLGSGTLIFEVA